VFGALVDVRTKDHREAVLEVVPNLFLSTVPIWFGAFILLSWKNINNTWLGLMYGNVQSGEFCLYATATLGPLYYFIFKDYKASPKFPSGRAFMIIASLILLLSGGLFAAQRAEGTFGGAQFLDHQFIFTISWINYVVAAVTVYLAHVYKNFLESGAAVRTNRDTQDFVEGFLSRPKE
jgi:hypothetical protein